MCQMGATVSNTGVLGQIKLCVHVYELKRPCVPSKVGGWDRQEKIKSCAYYGVDAELRYFEEITLLIDSAFLSAL